MLDEALLRPGRLEVQVEIGLADEKGRLQILKVGKPCHGDACSTAVYMLTGCMAAAWDCMDMSSALGICGLSMRTDLSWTSESLN